MELPNLIKEVLEIGSEIEKMSEQVRFFHCSLEEHNYFNLYVNVIYLKQNKREQKSLFSSVGG